MADNCKKLHIAIFPWLAFGHMIPFLELAKKIAQKGHIVSFISTPRNIKRLPKIPQSLSNSINLVQLPLPHVKNLPENAEATMDVPHHMIPYLKKAHDKLEEPLSLFLQTHLPDWIIYDFAPHWLPPIAAEIGISRARLSIFNASHVSFVGSSQTHLLDGHVAKKVFDDYEINNNSGVSDLFRIRSTVEGSEVYLIRSCTEVEDERLRVLPEILRKPVVPVGLLPSSAHDSGVEKDETWEHVCGWLNKHEKGCMVYVALGSEVRPSQEDFNELALGLELSGLPFFWALRRPSGLGDCDPVKLPDGFEDRTVGRGVVWTSWAPQVKILAHESVGGFLTHSGWSSIIEGLQFGRPLIMLPFIGDQGLNARVFDGEVGVEVPRNKQDGSFTRNSVAESLRLVVEEEKGKTYRDKAKKMSEIFGDKDLHDRYVDKCIEYLEIKRPST